MATKWAICGAGQISNDLCLCLNSLPQTEHKILAVSAKDIDRAKEFAQRHNIPQSFGSYEELLNVPDIDVVYVGNIHPHHVETCLLFINAGKNVLCEKPLSLTLEGCSRVLSAVKEKGVFFLEGWWSRFFPVYKLLRDEVFNKGTIGDVKLIEASFCGLKLTPERLEKWKLGGGGLTDIGAYGIQVANIFFKEKPNDIKATATLTKTGEDKSGAILLKYSNDSLACLTYCMETPDGSNHLIVRGTKGNIFIPDQFWCPSQVIINGTLIKCPLPDVQNKESFKFSGSEGLIYEIQHVRECLLKGSKECPEMRHQDSETIMSILHEVSRQCGMNYSKL
ncbi:hypothetical protein Btru_058641 [Bulinus truncatus]|nr:hypothetical protein Btru_058641 [Bulinus truncatus]